MKLTHTVFAAASSMLMLAFGGLATDAQAAAVSITKSSGWLETAYVEWTNDLANYQSYNVYCRPAGGSYVQLDKELVRNYGSYGRADALGLAAGSYQLKVVPVKADGTEDTANQSETSQLDVKAHDRTGFAFVNKTNKSFNPAEGLGAYKADGTLKDDARVLYVDANTAKTVTLDVVTSSKGASTTLTGLQTIVGDAGYKKGYETRPLCIRIIGTLTDSDMDDFQSSAEGFQIKGKNSYSPMPITVEGVGNDATVKGFGFQITNSSGVEFRNFGIMLCMDDGISIQVDNEHVWVHNMDFFYGGTGSDSDQAKGDGTVDLKDDSQYITISYNHFFDSGKSSLCGMKSESGPNYITYHHNWFDHSDSRHPRIRTMSVHIYNNYFDGVAKYGAGVTCGGNAFVESNYFRNTKYPMLINHQGTDAQGDGTFDDANGGIIKSCANVIINAKSYITYAEDNVEFDAYEVAERTATVPSSVTAKAGGSSYDNFDTSDIMYACTPDKAEDIPSIVEGDYGAGRCEHGDFVWQFDNATQDENYEVITALKSEISAYKSSFVNYYDGTTNPNTGTYTATGGDKEKHPDYVPSYVAGGGGSSSENTDIIKWVFTNWSADTKTAVTSNANWVIKGDGTERYSQSFANASLGLAETDGLTFDGNVLLSFDSSKGSYLQGSFGINVPVQPGDEVTISFANTGSKNGTRDLMVNDTKVGSSSSTTKETATYTVPDGVTSIVVKGSASLNYYYISIAREINSGEETDPDTPDTPTAVAETQADIVSVSYFSLSGQRLTQPSHGICVKIVTLADGSKLSKLISVK